jgi:hypothetical protein
VVNVAPFVSEIVGTFNFTRDSLVTLPKVPPARSKVYAGALVPIPTLLLLITMRVTPEVSNANCEVPTKCIPEEGSAEKLYAGAAAVPATSVTA